MSWRQIEQDDHKRVVRMLEHYLNGDANAVRYCLDILYICHLWDDLEDGDKERTEAEKAEAIRAAMSNIPTNPFYIAHFHILSSMTHSAILQWDASNILCYGDEDQKFTAFMIRNAILAIIHYCMFLVGGPQWATENNAQFWNDINSGVHKKYVEFCEEYKNG